MGDLSLLLFGQGGVNASGDPLHVNDDDVTLAQNASWFSDGKRGGLSKRLGIVKINAVALAGTVLGICSVTFVDSAATTILTDDALYTLFDDLFLVLTE